jgi:hypothetical protein
VTERPRDGAEDHGLEYVYPLDVRTEVERHRWDLAMRAARHFFEDVAGDEALIWSATGSLYRSDIPTE